jgi:hypothetical protein
MPLLSSEPKIYPLLRSGRALRELRRHAERVRGPDVRVLSCEGPYDDTLLYITEGWTVEAAKAYARNLGFKPLYIVNLWRKP